MAREQRTFTRELKQEALHLAESSEKSLTQIARDLGIADSTLSHWRKQLREEGVQAFPGSGHQQPLEEENRRLRRENEVLKQERDILKKQSASSRTRSLEVPVYCGPSGRVSCGTHVQGS